MPSASQLFYATLVRSGATRIRRRLHNGAAVFCFHNVVPADQAGSGDASLHMEVGAFSGLVDWIASTYTVVPLQEIVERTARRQPLHGLASLTFDDAYRGTFQHAIPELRRRNLPSTVFVVSGASERPDLFWWDRLGSLGLLSADVRMECLHRLYGDSERVLNRFPRARSVVLPDTFRPVPWTELRTELLRGDVSIGSHTATHRNLAALSPKEVRAELLTSRTSIEERLGVEARLVSYPYGLHTHHVVAEAGAAGYEGGAILSATTTTTDCLPLAVRRINVPAGINANALECWAAGYRVRKPA